MSVALKIPELGESVTEIYIGKWYKSAGDSVEQDEPLVELESEKATVDLRAPASGTLAKIVKNTGDTADVGEVIGQIDEATTPKKRPREPKSAKPTANEPTAPESAEQNNAVTTRHAEDGREKAAKRKPPDREAQQPADAATPRGDISTQGVESPTKRRAKREAAQRRAKKERPQSASTKTPPATKETTADDRDVERVPMSPIRRRIALRLVEAQKSAALLTTFNEIDMSAVKEIRAQYGESFEKRHGVRLGFMSFFVRAAVEALKQCPELNAIVEGDDIVYRRYYDIGVAISTDKGLVVPVLRDADRLGFAEIEKAIEELATRARDGNLKVDELQGGTFTITNGGVFGSLLSTPIVNPPQSGVLGMHTIQDRPVARDNQIVIRPMMYVALTYDHRIVDGREAVTFLRRIKETLEEPARLLLDV